MIRVYLDFDPGSPDLPPFIPWIARIDAKVFKCEGISLKHNKPCTLHARFIYVDQDGILNYFCRNHLGTNRLNAESYPLHGNIEEQKRCERWVQKNTTDTRGLFK